MDSNNKKCQPVISSNQKSIMLLLNRSSIHNIEIDKNTENEYRKKFKEWYECIYATEFGKELIDIAAQCENLKLIFDFECPTVS